MKRKKKIPYLEVLKRLTGFSIPLFGVQWDPPKSEREIVRHLLTFLEDRRALYAPRFQEVEIEVERSVLQIREELTKTLQDLSEDSKAAGSVRAMRAACRKFLTNSPFFLDFFVALGELRTVFGIHIATLSVRYGIDLEEEIVSILPAQGED